MQIAIRADAGELMGAGHIIRCLTLADGLKGRGHDVLFLARNLTDFTLARMRSSGHDIRILPTASTPVDDELAHAGWLGCSQSEDVDQCRQACSDKSVDWLIVDHYGIDRKWESEARRFAGKIMAIDDLADRKHDCDILLDQNLIEDWQHRYDKLVSGECLALMGPRYALLQPAYSRLAAQSKGSRSEIQRILVSFGTSDRWNLTANAVSEAREIFPESVQIDVVLSSTQAELAAFCAGFANLNVHRDLPTLAELMLVADLAVGASGATSWERICLGLPSLVVILAQNQEPIAKALQDNGLALCLGHADEITRQTFNDAFRQMRAPDAMAWFNEEVAAEIDGLGTSRVVEVIEGLSAPDTLFP